MEPALGTSTLPAVLMHEFGHSIGLGHGVGDTIMAGALRKALSDIDKKGAKAIYDHHSPHGAPQ